MAAKGSMSKNKLHLEGELTIQRAAELRTIFHDAQQQSATVEVDLSRVTRIDLACLQLFCAAQKTASRAGSQWSVINIADSVLHRAGADAGFNYQLKCRSCPEADCLWTGGEHNV